MDITICFIALLGLVFMARRKCEAVACLFIQVKYNNYELLYCALYLWRINLIWFDLILYLYLVKLLLSVCDVFFFFFCYATSYGEYRWVYRPKNRLFWCRLQFIEEDLTAIVCGNVSLLVSALSYQTNKCALYIHCQSLAKVSPFWTWKATFIFKYFRFFFDKTSVTY